MPILPERNSIDRAHATYIILHRPIRQTPHHIDFPPGIAQLLTQRLAVPIAVARLVPDCYRCAEGHDPEEEGFCVAGRIRIPGCEAVGDGIVLSGRK
jgi:hypothetical protein